MRRQKRGGPRSFAKKNHLKFEGNLGVKWFLLGFYGDMMGFNGDIMGFNGMSNSFDWVLNGIQIDVFAPFFHESIMSD
jgi:hypothetical protein